MSRDSHSAKRRKTTSDTKEAVAPSSLESASAETLISTRSSLLKSPITPPREDSIPSRVTHDVSQDADADLLDLLDLSELSTTRDLDSRFCRLAHELFHNHRIEIRTQSGSQEQLQILELEFYLYKTGCHEDPFTHVSNEQAQCGRWCASL